MWFLQRKVILTKDNLVKRNWQGCTKCCFCDQEEIIQHLFFDCPFAKVLWRIVHLPFSLTPPINTTNLFGNRLNGVNQKDKQHIRVGVCATLWALWHVRNNFIFNQFSFPSFLQVIPLASHWIRTWSYLLPEEQRQDMDTGCTRLEMVAQALYNRFGWSTERRIEC